MKLAVTKVQTLMFLIVSLTSAALAVLLAIAAGSRDLLIVSTPGWVISAFFAYKYLTFGRAKQKEEEHRRSRNRHKH